MTFNVYPMQCSRYLHVGWIGVVITEYGIKFPSKDSKPNYGSEAIQRSDHCTTTDKHICTTIESATEENLLRYKLNYVIHQGHQML